MKYLIYTVAWPAVPRTENIVLLGPQVPVPVLRDEFLTVVVVVCEAHFWFVPNTVAGLLCFLLWG